MKFSDYNCFFSPRPGSKTGWDNLAVAHLKLSLNNKRSSAVRVVANIGSNSRTTLATTTTTPTTTIVQPNSKQTIEDVLVRLLVNDDVISREIRIAFFDQESGKRLLVNGKLDIELPLKLVGQNVYRIEKEISFSDKSNNIHFTN